MRGKTILSGKTSGQVILPKAQPTWKPSKKISNRKTRALRRSRKPKQALVLLHRKGSRASGWWPAMLRAPLCISGSAMCPTKGSVAEVGGPLPPLIFRPHTPAVYFPILPSVTRDTGQPHRENAKSLELFPLHFLLWATCTSTFPSRAQGRQKPFKVGDGTVPHPVYSKNSNHPV